ncbi:MAG: hypothetical protein IKQ32_02895 [Prevotella sp.]|nr:hypothetical protein [Prevotella sp.]
MTVSIFNPEHDLALADGTSNYTPPKVVRQLRQELGELSALWRKEGEVTVWGWDKAIVRELKQMGVADEQLPTEKQLEAIRTLSNRSQAVELLASLRQMEGTTGTAKVCYSYDDVLHFHAEHGATIVKSPWSSSGRGVKEFKVGGDSDKSRSFVEGTIARQGTVIAEKKCDKIADLALEYVMDKEGEIHYEGLSVFSTVHGAYSGNLLLPEEEKRERVRPYISDDLMHEVSYQIKQFIAPRLKGVYWGPLGVDMMICKSASSGTYLLNPCVEINLRRTMGHVAIALTNKGHRGMMKIMYDKNEYKYKLIIE